MDLDCVLELLVPSLPIAVVTVRVQNCQTRSFSWHKSKQRPWGATFFLYDWTSQVGPLRVHNSKLEALERWPGFGRSLLLRSSPCMAALHVLRSSSGVFLKCRLDHSHAPAFRSTESISCRVRAPNPKIHALFPEHLAYKLEIPCSWIPRPGIYFAARSSWSMNP